MSERFSMAGKNALVTGGTRGIGLAIARGFLESGATVTIASRRQENVDSAAAELGDKEKVLGVAAHVGNAEDRQRLIGAAEERFGAINVLVNNAGTNPFYGNIAEAEEWAWDKTMDVNLKAPYMLSVGLGKKMMAHGGGAIINIASVAGLQASTNQGIYSVTKSALIMLTKVLARDMGHGGVRANAILPGLIKTELSRAMWENEDTLARVVKATSLGRIGRVDELIGAAIFLASDAGSYTSGAVIQVDGGMVI
jgi:NAD(P)-dependent dehydrogenase (short-subunit alcohol dehydrogenase family)